MKLFARVNYRFQRRLALVWSGAQRRFTRAGWFVLGGVLVTALMFDTRNTAGYQAFSLLLALLLLAFAFSRFFRLSFSAVRLLPRFATVGQSFTYRVRVKNLSSRPQSDLALLEDLASCGPSFAEWLETRRGQAKSARSLRLIGRQRSSPTKLAKVKDAVVPAMQSNQEVDVRVEITSLRRGVLHFDGLSLARTDPLGLIRAVKRARLPQSVLILPKRYHLPPIALPGRMRYQAGGVALASNVGQSDEFVALRDYRRGDPLRHIHWRSWAKAGKPIVKEFEDEFFVRHALVLDTFSDQPEDQAFEEAVSVAASFACTIRTQESLLDLLFIGAQAYCFTAGRGLAHGDQMLEILASVGRCSGKPFRTLETLVLNHASAVSGCIFVLLAWDDQRQSLVKKLKAFGLPILVVVVVCAAPEKPLDPGPMRDEPSCFRTLVAGQIEQGLGTL
jgi:uncharacterized protein (DUF58 family)